MSICSLALAVGCSQPVGSQPVDSLEATAEEVAKAPAGEMQMITFGPGEDGWPPVSEFINMEKVVAVTKVYALFLLDFFKAQKA